MGNWETGNWLIGEMEDYRTFEDLDCWKQCRKIRQAVESFCKTLPKEEKFRLVDQMIRCARSSTANIAEGYGRYHYKENIQFCRMSRGSLFELIDHLVCCLDNELIKDSEYKGLRGETESGMRLINGYIKYLKKQI